MVQPWFEAINSPLVTSISNFVLFGLMTFTGVSLLISSQKYNEDLPFSWLIQAFGLFFVGAGISRFLSGYVYWNQQARALLATENVITDGLAMLPAILVPLQIPRVGKLLKNEKQYVQEQIDAVRDSKEHLRMINEGANMATFIWDVGKNKTTWTGSEIYGRPFSEFDRIEDRMKVIHPEDWETYRELIQSARFGIRPYMIQYRIIRPDKSVRWIEGRGQLQYTDDGRPARMLGVCIDITARKNAELTLVESEKAAATGRLAATLAHEINNPLETISNHIYLLDSKSEDPQHKERIRLIDKEVRHIANIVKQTMIFQRDAQSPQPIDVSVVLDDVLSLLSRHLLKKDIRVTKDYRSGYVIAYPGELRQVFTNLIRNAIEAMSIQGQLVLSVRFVNQKAVIQVRDNGTGIADDLKAHLFEPFFTTKGEQGSGIGLWVSQGLVTKVGGTIDLESCIAGENRGTCFKVVLPCLPTSVRAASISPN